MHFHQTQHVNENTKQIGNGIYDSHNKIVKARKQQRRSIRFFEQAIEKTLE